MSLTIRGTDWDTLMKGIEDGTLVTPQRIIDILKSASYVIDPSKIGDLDASKIVSGDVSTEILLKNIMKALNLAEGSISIDKLKANVVEAINISAQNISADKLKATVVEAVNLSAENISTDRLKANVIEAINANIGTAVIDHAIIPDLDASKITSGEISTEALKGNVVNAINLSAESALINGAKIQEATITKAHIHDLSIDSTKIIDASIISAKIQDAAINSAKIDSLAVQTAHIANLAVSEAKIANLAVTNAKIDNLAVTNAKIANLAVDTAKIANAAITEAKIGSAQIVNAHIKDVYAEKITAGDISTDRMKANVVEAVNLSATDISADRIKVGVIDAINANIGIANIDGAIIKGASITNAQIANLNACKINAGDITADRMKVNVVEAVNLSATDISADRIKVGVIDAINANIGTAGIGTAFIDGAVIKEASITNAHISNLDASKINAGNINADRIKAGVIDAINANIGTATINGAVISNLNAGSITAGDITANLIRANVITAINTSTETIVIDSSKIGSMTVDGKVVVGYGGYNLVKNSDFLFNDKNGNILNWVPIGTIPARTSTGDFRWSNNCIYGESTVNSVVGVEQTLPLDLAGKDLSLTAWVKWEGVKQGTTADNTLRVEVHYQYDTGNGIVDQKETRLLYGTCETGAFQRVKRAMSLTPLSPGWKANFIKVKIYLNNCTGKFWATCIQVEEGGISTAWNRNKEEFNGVANNVIISSDGISITGGKLVVTNDSGVVTIQDGNIAANTITSGMIHTSGLNASVIKTGSIDASVINVNSGNVVMDGTGVSIKESDKVAVQLGSLNGKYGIFAGDTSLTSNGLTISGTSSSISLGGGKFSVTGMGILTATSGTIGGWSINGTTISSTNSKLILDSSGSMKAYSSTDNAKYVTIDSNGMTITKGAVSITLNDGTVAMGPSSINADAVKVGTLTATNSMKIEGGNVLIDNTGMKVSGTAGIYVSGSQGIKIKEGTMEVQDSTSVSQVTVGQYGTGKYGIKAGGSILDGNGITLSQGTISLGGKFTVDTLGKLVATDATITGTINSNLGYFGTSINGVSIGTTGLTVVGTGKITNSNGNFSLSSTGISATGGTIGGWTIGATEIYSNNLRLNSNGSILAGLNNQVSISSSLGINVATGKFSVDLTGAMVAQNATITGRVTATSGSVGGWVIGEHSITGGSLILSDTGSISSTNFNVDTTGKVTATNASLSGSLTTSNLSATGGTIGGWTIGTTEIHAGNIHLNSIGSISSTNFSMDTTGKITATGASITGTISTSNITATGGTIGGWSISDSKLTSGNISIDSLMQKISIGTNISLNNDGSATLGKLSILPTGAVSSPNFSIDASGNATLSGKITATSGTLGGWLVSDTTIKSSDSGVILDSISKSIKAGNATLSSSGLTITGGAVNITTSVTGTQKLSITSNGIVAEMDSKNKVTFDGTGIWVIKNGNVVGSAITKDGIIGTLLTEQSINGSKFDKIPPAKPTIVNVTTGVLQLAENQKVNAEVTFMSITDADRSGYKVYLKEGFFSDETHYFVPQAVLPRDTGDNTTPIQVKYSIMDIKPNTVYTVVVTAMDVTGNESDIDPNLSVTFTSVKDSIAPAPLDYVQAVPGFQMIVVTWNTAIQNWDVARQRKIGTCTDINNYLVYRSTDGVNFEQIGEIKGTFVVDKLVDYNTAYMYRVIPVDLSGNIPLTPEGKPYYTVSVPVRPSQVGAADIIAGSITTESGIISSIDAKVIKTGTFSADRIKGGNLQLGGGIGFGGELILYNDWNDQVAKYDSKGTLVQLFHHNDPVTGLPTFDQAMRVINGETGVPYLSFGMDGAIRTLNGLCSSTDISSGTSQDEVMTYPSMLSLHHYDYDVTKPSVAPTNEYYTDITQLKTSPGMRISTSIGKKYIIQQLTQNVTRGSSTSDLITVVQMIPFTTVVTIDSVVCKGVTYSPANYKLSSNSVDWSSATQKPALGDVYQVTFKIQTAYNQGVNTPVGYIEIGPKDGTAAHFYTDRGKFLFNTDIHTQGNLILKDNITLSGSTNNGLCVTTPTGWTQMGSQNSDWSHFITDRSKFYFDKPIHINEGILSSYCSNALTLQTNGTTRMTIVNSTGNVGIGTETPSCKLDVSGDIKSTGIITSSKVQGKLFTSYSGLDEINNAPWYGVGRSNITLSGEAGPTVQLAGYYGLNMKTGQHELVIPNGSGHIAYDGNTIWHKGNQGHGSGLVADMIDGIHGSQIVRNDINSSIQARISVLSAQGGGILTIKEVGPGYSADDAALIVDTENPQGTANYLYQGRCAGTNVFSVKANGDITTSGCINTGGVITSPVGSGRRTLQAGDSWTALCLNSHANHTWLRNTVGAWTFQSGVASDNWSRSFQVLIPPKDTGECQNDTYVTIGQRSSCTTQGTYRGVSIVKYVDDNVVNGDLSVGDLTVSRKLGIGTTTPSSLLEISGGSLRFSGVPEGAGQIQSNSVIKFANGGSAQRVFTGGLGVSSLWDDCETNNVPYGIYTKGGMKSTGQVIIAGAAVDRPLVVRGISGSQGGLNGIADVLFLNYDSDLPVMIGKDNPVTLCSGSNPTISKAGYKLFLGSSAWDRNNGETAVLGALVAPNSESNSRFMMYNDGNGKANLYIDGDIYVNEGYRKVASFAPDGNFYTSTIGSGCGNEIWGLSSSNKLWINYRGRGGDITSFYQDTIIGDGKGKMVLAVIGSAHNVGIGTETPSEALAVVGNIRTSGQVKADGGVSISSKFSIVYNSTEDSLDFNYG